MPPFRVTRLTRLYPFSILPFALARAYDSERGPKGPNLGRQTVGGRQGLPAGCRCGGRKGNDARRKGHEDDERRPGRGAVGAIAEKLHQGGRRCRFGHGGFGGGRLRGPEPAERQGRFGERDRVGRRMRRAGGGRRSGGPGHGADGGHGRRRREDPASGERQFRIRERQQHILVGRHLHGRRQRPAVRIPEGTPWRLHRNAGCDTEGVCGRDDPPSGMAERAGRHRRAADRLSQQSRRMERTAPCRRDVRHLLQQGRPGRHDPCGQVPGRGPGGPCRHRYAPDRSSPDGAGAGS